MRSCFVADDQLMDLWSQLGELAQSETPIQMILCELIVTELGMVD